MGIIYNQKNENFNADDTVILRCVFEDMKVNSIWSCGKNYTRMKNHVIKDTIMRRCNTLNHDAGYHAGALKYLLTDHMLVDGVISYDNNGPGFWLDSG